MFILYRNETLSKAFLHLYSAQFGAIDNPSLTILCTPSCAATLGSFKKLEQEFQLQLQRELVTAPG
jgi:hypothetical protein